MKGTAEEIAAALNDLADAHLAATVAVAKAKANYTAAWADYEAAWLKLDLLTRAQEGESV